MQPSPFRGLGLAPPMASIYNTFTELFIRGSVHELGDITHNVNVSKLAPLGLKLSFSIMQ
jgi:hypothetical protein